MTTHLGGPESPEKLAERQATFEGLAEAGTGMMFTIVDVDTGDKIGSVGYWDRTWHDEDVYEMGWFVVPGFQGRGVASSATAQALDLMRAERRHDAVHAFPSVDNAPSNAICRKLGFELVERCEFEYPAGRFMTCNDWRLVL